MKRVLPLIAAAAVAISLASCSSGTEAQPDSSGSSPIVVPSDPASDRSGEKDAGDQDQAGKDKDSTEDSGSTSENDSDRSDSAGGQKAPESSSVTVTINGEETVVEPTNVYCSGSPGNIEHIIGKVNNQIPLIKVAGDSEFAMVKLHRQGPPEKAERPSNISFGDEWVAFDDATIGSATVNGTMVCTQWED